VRTNVATISSVDSTVVYTERTVFTLLCAKCELVVSTFSEFIQSFDDDIVSLTASGVSESSGCSMNRGPELLGPRVVGPHTKIFIYYEKIIAFIV